MKTLLAATVQRISALDNYKNLSSASLYNHILMPKIHCVLKEDVDKITHLLLINAFHYSLRTC